MVAEADDALMEKFFDAGTLASGRPGGRVEARSGDVADLPAVLRFSGRQRRHDSRCSTAIINYVPSPAERGIQLVDDSRLAASDSGPAAAFVWKTVADPFAGRITMFSVAQRCVEIRFHGDNANRETPERLGHLLLLQGKTQTNVPEVKAGDIGAVAKLKETLTGDLLIEKAADRSRCRRSPSRSRSSRMRSSRRAAATRRRSAPRCIGSRKRIPSIGYSRDPQTKELLLAGQGQLHIEVTVAKLKRRFGVEVLLKPPRIPYRETISAAVEAHGRHKKQTGGHGQFGDCKVKFEPLPRGSEFQFVDDIFGGSIPRQFVPAIEKGLQDARMRGFLAGYPMVDFRATVIDGSYHAVDSSEMSFKMAASLAFKDGMSRARPTLLEPIMDVEVYAPNDYAGDLMGDLNSRRGRIGGMDTRGASTVIRAKVPMSEMLTYEQHLTSATGGRGSYHMEFSHYEEVPAAPARQDRRRGEGRTRPGGGRRRLTQTARRAWTDAQSAGTDAQGAWTSAERCRCT